MPSLSLSSRVKLNDGNEIPILGFGTYELDGEDAYKAVKWALEAGYRHIDSAEWYENEAEVGRAIRDWCTSTGTPRSAIFYTTKLKFNAGRAAVDKSIKKSVDACGLGYVDLYLIHGPIGGRQARKESWEACVAARKAGLARSVGISTFGVRQMQELLADVPGEIPAVNQIDLHPFQTRTDVVGFCAQHGIALEAWAPLVRGLRFSHPSIAALAEKYGKTPAQVLLRYSLQKGFVAIPKSASRARIRANLELFEFALEPAEMDHLDSLDEGLVTDWDPTHDPRLIASLPDAFATGAESLERECRSDEDGA